MPMTKREEDELYDGLDQLRRTSAGAAARKRILSRAELGLTLFFAFMLVAVLLSAAIH